MIDRLHRRFRSRFPGGARGIAREGLQATMRAYFDRRTPGGCDVMAEEWDQLVLLDGCRVDSFRRQHTFEGDFQTRISKGSATPTFLDRNFGGETYPDTVYVTANPMHRVDEWCDADLEGVFHDVVDVWEDDWDDTAGTVLPETMAAAAVRARESYPDKRLLVHFVQPHYPFVGPTGRRLTHSGLNGKRRVTGAGPDADETPVWDLLRGGELSAERARRAYEENLWLVLPYVRSLLAAFEGTTVVTSDHGNQFGEFATPFPVRLYGHPDRLRVPDLVEVPWLVVRDEHRPAADESLGAASPTPDDAETSGSHPRLETDGDRRGREPGDVVRTPEPTADGGSATVETGPLVSVVIPTHYRNEALSKAIESAREQRYDPIEIVVVDDSGTGHARPVAERYDVSYVAHDRNRGANAARTTGSREAAGRYVQFLDDDDLLHPTKVRRQVAVLERLPRVGVAYCGYVTDRSRRLPEPDADRDVLEHALRFGPKACTNSTMLISASVLEDVLPLANRDGADDVGLCIELAIRTEFEPMREPLVYKQDRHDNRSKRPAVGRELLRIVDEYDSLYDDFPPQVRQTALRNAYRTLGENHLQDRQWSSAAVTAFARSLVAADDPSGADVGRLLASLFGAPGLRLAAGLYRRLESD